MGSWINDLDLFSIKKYQTTDEVIEIMILKHPVLARHAFIHKEDGACMWRGGGTAAAHGTISRLV